MNIFGWLKSFSKQKLPPLQKSEIEERIERDYYFMAPEVREAYRRQDDVHVTLAELEPVIVYGTPRTTKELAELFYCDEETIVRQLIRLRDCG